MAYRIGGWESFALAQVGASAALLGLVFVGISINLRDIIGSGSLVPGQRREVLSTELILLAVALFAIVFYLQRDAVAQSDPGKPGPPRGSLAIRRVFGLGTAALVAVTGITLAAQAGGGLYWYPAAVLAAYVGALTNAWILLIEILR